MSSYRDLEDLQVLEEFQGFQGPQEFLEQKDLQEIRDTLALWDNLVSQGNRDLQER